MFNVDGVEYTKVCGRSKATRWISLVLSLIIIIILWRGIANVSVTNNTLLNHSLSTDSQIDTYYVDGVSLTHGNSPNQNIWTFASPMNEDPLYPFLIVPALTLLYQV